MKRLIFCWIFFASFLLGYELKNEYFVSKNEIYSTDLFEGVPKFLLVSMGDRFEVRVESEKIINEFAKNKIKLNSKFAEIAFVFQTDSKLEKVVWQIKNAFLQYYKNHQLNLKSIKLKPLGKVINQAGEIEAKINEGMFKKNTFTLALSAKNGQKWINFAYLCQIEADFEVFVATQDIRAGSDLGIQNTRIESIPFEGFLNLPINQAQMQTSSAKSFIKQGQVITEQKIKPKTLVFKGELIEVSMQEGGVSIQARMEAVQNGALGEVIRVKNLESKKMIKVVVVGKSKGMIP